MNDFYMEIVQSDMDEHPANNKISLIFFSTLGEYGQSYCLPIDHNEAICFPTTLERLRETLKLSNTQKIVRDKKRAINLIGVDYSFIDLDVIEYLSDGKRDRLVDGSECSSFIKSNFPDRRDLNRSVPIYDFISRYEQSSKPSRKIHRNVLDDRGFQFINDVAYNSFAELERVGIGVDIEVFGESYGTDKSKKINVKNPLVYSEYHLLTSTCRPSNCYGGVNYAAVNKTDGSRKSFVSRYGDDGMLVMMDYNAFHPRLIAQLVNYPISRDENPYAILAQSYFGKKLEDIDEEDLAVSKVLTFQQIYGTFDDRWINTPFFKKIQSFINHRWKFFVENGYVETPMFNRHIKRCHIEDPSPSKLFNYILQGYETEVAVVNLGILQKYLSDKKTKAILYTYDSIMFDAHKDDKISTIRDLKDIMENSKMPVKVYAGKNYSDMPKIDFR